MFGLLISFLQRLSVVLFYAVFSLTITFLLKSVGTSYNCCKEKLSFKINESLYFCFAILLLCVLMLVPSFRFVREIGVTTISGQYNFGGTDTPEYKRLYDITEGVSYSGALKLTNKEYIFTFICWVFKNLHIPFELCLCLFNFFMFLGFLNYCKIFNLKEISFFPLFCLSVLYLGSFNTLRWSVTLILSSYLCKYILEKKYFKTILFTFFSIGIQEASIVFLMPIFGFFVTKNLKRKKLAFLYFLILLIICYIPSTLDYTIFKNNKHYTQIWGGGQVPITWIALYSIFLINLLFVNRNYLKDKKNKEIFYIILFLIPPTVLEFTFFLAYRFSYYAHPIFYMYIIGLMSSNRKKGILGVGCNLLYVFFMVSIILKYFETGGGVEHSGLPFVWGNIY